MSTSYLIARCYRCGSTMQLVIEGVRSDAFLCPVCLEGEIECKVNQSGTQKRQGVIDGLQNLGQYVAAPVKLSVN